MRLISIMAIYACMITSVDARPINRADRTAILNWAKETLVDPYTLRSTTISDLVEVKGTTVVCIEFNPKNNVGGYEGLMRFPFIETPEGLVPTSRMRSNVTTATCYDPQIKLKPFPELSNIR